MGLRRAEEMEPFSFPLSCIVAVGPTGGWVIELKLFL